jgi:hypothetical protein
MMDQFTVVVPVKEDGKILSINVAIHPKIN